MNYILVYIVKGNTELAVDTDTSNKEEAISFANQYIKSREGLFEYLYLSNNTTQLEYSYSSCEWEEA